MGIIVVCLAIVGAGFVAGIMPVLGPLILGLAVEDFNARLRQKADKRLRTVMMMMEDKAERLESMLMLLNVEMAVTGLLISGHYFFDFERTLWQVGLFITAYAFFRLLRFAGRHEAKRPGLKW